jgi:hypothetical protein
LKCEQWDSAGALSKFHIGLWLEEAGLQSVSIMSSNKIIHYFGTQPAKIILLWYNYTLAVSTKDSKLQTLNLS